MNDTRNYFVEEIEQNELMSKKHKEFSAALNYIKLFLILSFTVYGCISISAFASLLGIPIRITSSVIGSKKMLVITAGIKKYKSIIRKRKRSKIK